jgi:hypothetical protein
MSIDNTTSSALFFLFVILFGALVRFCFADIDRVQQERNRRADELMAQQKKCGCCHCKWRLEKEEEKERERREYPGDCAIS